MVIPYHGVDTETSAGYLRRFSVSQSSAITIRNSKKNLSSLHYSWRGIPRNDGDNNTFAITQLPAIITITKDIGCEHAKAWNVITVVVVVVVVIKIIMEDIRKIEK